jgi:chorismate lyase/3-hydroxybenzoate synthase
LYDKLDIASLASASVGPNVLDAAMKEKSTAAIQLVFAGHSQLKRILTEYSGRILGVFAYSSTRPELPQGFPCAWVPMPVFGETIWYELWVSSKPVVASLDRNLCFSCDGRFLFGSFVFDETDFALLESKTFDAYSTIFDTLNREGYPALLRAWNYFPHINDEACGIERYRAFNVGRHEAFCSKDRIIAEGAVPAACALGTKQGSLVVCFLAGKAPGSVIENPRQTNAYCYPRDFGPRSPTFSRGILIDDVLLISGTASIVGSESLHQDDVLSQVDETLRNLQVVVEQAQKRGFEASDQAGLCLNVYLRNADDYPVVRRRLDEAFGHAKHVAYLMADVCRADLMVEIEAFWMPA